nr:MAG TPA: hypothetical protein [Caudoviricetes sp.]
MTKRQRDVQREKNLDAALILVWGIFLLIVLFH